MMAQLNHFGEGIMIEHQQTEPIMQYEDLGDRYQLLDLIGRGGMATIYRARDIRMDRVVAVKVLREAYNTDQKFVKRFQREAKAASALHHPNIVQVYDYGQTDGNYYIVMELVEGTDLSRYLCYRGVLDVDRAVIIAHDVALGLGAAHRRRIVHRDVKPQNVLIGSVGSIKLTDFGIVSVNNDMNAERLTTSGMTLGTVQYFAPEQAQGEIVSPAADVYALGIVMYEMLTGHTPFDGDSAVAVALQHIRDQPTPPSQFNPCIPTALEEIVLRCLGKVPEMRFRDGSQLARALEIFSDAEFAETVPQTPGRAPIPTTSHQIPSHQSKSGRGGTRRDSRFASILTLLILLAALLLLGFSVYLVVQPGLKTLPSFAGFLIALSSPHVLCSCRVVDGIFRRCYTMIPGACYRKD
jgi:eukaryotic-like serine/threonine-protein kinase